jgi:hypothetical protein
VEKKDARTVALETLYRTGNFSQARPLAAQMKSDESLKEADRGTAQRLDKAMSSDPAAAIVFAITLFALVFITLHHLL